MTVGKLCMQKMHRNSRAFIRTPMSTECSEGFSVEGVVPDALTCGNQAQHLRLAQTPIAALQHPVIFI
eukprot:5736782-Amphidinium_carterae.2